MNQAALLRSVCPALLLVAAASSGHVWAGDCYANWSEAAPIVRKEGLATVESMALLARERISGAIVKTTLCTEGEGFVYRLLVRDPSGHLTNHTVDARAPFAETSSRTITPHVP